MSFRHSDLRRGTWQLLTIAEQMANIGSEVERTLKWKEKNPQISQNALYRCLDLIDLSLASTRNYSTLKEFSRIREMLVDYFIGSNEYHSAKNSWKNYFYAYTKYAQKLRAIEKNE